MTAPIRFTGRLLLAAAAIAVGAGGAGYGLARLVAPPPHPEPAAAPQVRKVLYWYDPMAPDSHFDRPGKSPFMDMPLTARYADEAGAGGDAGVRIDASRAQNLGARLATVELADFATGLDLTGVVDFNQRQVAVVQARSAGFVQKAYGRAPGDVIASGAPIADVLIPAWVGAQTEYLAVRRLGDPAMEGAARQRLRLLGMSEALIADVARDGRPHSVVTITAPLGGVVQTLDARPGMSLAMGQTLAQITGLGTVWLNLAIPESQADQARVGRPVVARFAAYPGETFAGRVSAILPTVQADSRTLTVRVELANRGDRLRPGLFATAHLAGENRPALLAPSEAVIRTGRRSLVMLAGESGRYQAVEVRTGREDGGRTEILDGLNAGDRIVASGQFLIDSEASLTGVQVRPLPDAAAATTPAAAVSK